MEDILEGENYLKALRQANTLEIKQPQEALSLLNQIYEKMHANLDGFLQKFPDRKNDPKNLEIRIGKVKKKIEDYERKKILELIKSGDNQVDDFNFDEAKKEYKKALDLAKASKIDDLAQQAQEKLDSLVQAREDYEKRNKELSQIMQGVKKQGDSCSVEEIIPQYDRLLELARQLKREGIVTDYQAKREAIAAKAAKMADLKLNIDKLRKSGLDHLEKGRLGGSIKDFSEIATKIEEYNKI
jgi:uncharacterized protein YydD (DUF2326 family)